MERRSLSAHFYRLKSAPHHETSVRLATPRLNWGLFKAIAPAKGQSLRQVAAIRNSQRFKFVYKSPLQLVIARACGLERL